jgi:hypothetical protein
VGGRRFLLASLGKLYEGSIYQNSRTRVRDRKDRGKAGEQKTKEIRGRTQRYLDNILELN